MVLALPVLFLFVFENQFWNEILLLASVGAVPLSFLIGTVGEIGHEFDSWRPVTAPQHLVAFLTLWSILLTLSPFIFLDGQISFISLLASAVVARYQSLMEDLGDYVCRAIVTKTATSPLSEAFVSLMEASMALDEAALEGAAQHLRDLIASDEAQALSIELKPRVLENLEWFLANMTDVFSVLASSPDPADLRRRRGDEAVDPAVLLVLESIGFFTLPDSTSPMSRPSQEYIERGRARARLALRTSPSVASRVASEMFCELFLAAFGAHSLQALNEEHDIQEVGDIVSMAAEPFGVDRNRMADCVRYILSADRTALESEIARSDRLTVDVYYRAGDGRPVPLTDEDARFSLLVAAAVGSASLLELFPTVRGHRVAFVLALPLALAARSRAGAFLH